MASEMRRLAKLLVESRGESFESRYSRGESIQRVERALASVVPKGMVYTTAWRDERGATFLDVSFAPSRATRLFLNTSSVVFLLLLAATLWALVSPGEPPPGRFLVTLVTLLAILMFPFVVVAYGSRRESEESSLRKAIRKAIVEEE